MARICRLSPPRPLFPGLIKHTPTSPLAAMASRVGGHEHPCSSSLKLLIFALSLAWTEETSPVPEVMANFPRREGRIVGVEEKLFRRKGVREIGAPLVGRFPLLFSFPSWCTVSCAALLVRSVVSLSCPGTKGILSYEKASARRGTGANETARLLPLISSPRRVRSWPQVIRTFRMEDAARQS